MTQVAVKRVTDRIHKRRARRILSGMELGRTVWSKRGRRCLRSVAKELRVLLIALGWKMRGSVAL